MTLELQKSIEYYPYLMVSPASSSSSAHAWQYDVFLSFRGEDTRLGFADHLYSALRVRGIRTFRDDEKLQTGGIITESLHKAIQESRISIIILSQNFAFSSFCLDELVIILECKGQLVLPVFYGVDPSDVRHQRGSYGEALTRHEMRLRDNREKVNTWRMALKQVADLSGFNNKDEYEYKFILTIVKEVSKKIEHTPLHVADWSLECLK